MNDKTFVDSLICEAIKIAAGLERLNENLRSELKKITALGQTELANAMIVATIETHSKLYELEAAKFDSIMADVVKIIVSLGNQCRSIAAFPVDFTSIVGRKVELPKKLRNNLERLSAPNVWPFFFAQYPKRKKHEKTAPKGGLKNGITETGRNASPCG